MTDVETVLYVAGEVADADFDEATHTWTVGAKQARIVVATDGALPGTPDWGADGLEPYLGVAVHGLPNYFLVTGPDTAAQKSYIAKCLAHVGRTGSTRIEVRAATQRMYNDRSHGRARHSGHFWRRVGRKIPSAFDVRSTASGDAAEPAVYDGPATVEIGGQRLQTLVRLTGRVDPIDGHYHWRGTVFGLEPDVRLPHDIAVTVEDRTCRARLTERTPQASYSVTGVGAPPFPMAALEVEVPVL